MRFEKWQALANDYVIVEAAELGRPATVELVRALCDRHSGVGADGVLVLSPPDEPGFVARLRIFNPDGSEAELSGNGAREAIMYLRRAGWTDASQFSIQTAAGEIRPTILSETTCRVDMGRGALRHEGELHGRRFQHLTSATRRPSSPSTTSPRWRAWTSPRSARRSSPIRSSRGARTSRGSRCSMPARSARASSSAASARPRRAAPARAARRSSTSCAAATRR